MDRVTVPEAASRLKVSENALRKRIQRGTIEWDRDEDGRVYVYLPETMTDHADGIVTDQVADQTQLVQSMQDQIEYLRDTLKTRDQELAEMRRLLAGALERIPALEEGPRDERESSVAAAEESDKGQTPTDQEQPEKRSWWRRLFEG